MNTRAASFYADHGIASVAPAYEKQSVPGAVLMFASIACVIVWGGAPLIRKGVHLIGNLITCRELTVSVSVWSSIVKIVR